MEDTDVFVSFSIKVSVMDPISIVLIGMIAPEAAAHSTPVISRILSKQLVNLNCKKEKVRLNKQNELILILI